MNAEGNKVLEINVGVETITIWICDEQAKEFENTKRYMSLYKTGVNSGSSYWCSYRTFYNKKTNEISTILLIAPMSAAEDAAKIMATVKYNVK